MCIENTPSVVCIIFSIYSPKYYVSPKSMLTVHSCVATSELEPAILGSILTLNQALTCYINRDIFTGLPRKQPLSR